MEESQLLLQRAAFRPMSESKSSKLWCLANIDSGLSLEGYTFNEARAAISALPFDERTDWLVWKEGWKQWKPLVQVRELLEPLHRKMDPSAPPYESQLDEVESKIRNAFQEEPESASEDIHEMNTATRDLELSDHSFVERGHKRIKKRFKVHINQGANKFKSHTRDVSVGGLLLEDVLPDWVVGYCQVILVRPHSKQAVELTCFLVENQKPTDRRRLQIVALEDRDAELKLEKWLAA